MLRAGYSSRSVRTRAHLLMAGPEPQDEQGLREVVRLWEALFYVAMSRLMVSPLARS